MLETEISPPVGNNTVYLADYQPPTFLVHKVCMNFTLAAQTQVTTICEYERSGQHTEPLRLEGEKLALLRVKLDGKELSDSEYQLTASNLTIEVVPDKFVLEIVTQVEPQKNTELSGLYQSSGNFCTQCEAEGFRRITYFPDRPDVLAEYEVTVCAEKAHYPVLLSNGNPVARGDHNDGTHWATWHDPHPKPSYLFALVAGNLASIQDQFTTTSGQRVELNIFTQAHNIEKCQHAMESLKHAMLWDEQVYGREYDLDVYNIVAVDDFNMGAMENKGLNIFNSKYVLADQQTATDTDFQGIESVIGHEYFHNWSGNRVTCRDWFQLSLKEGFTVFRDQEFSADMGSRGVKRIRDVQIMRTHQFREDAGPMAHAVRPDSYQEINNFYTVTIYDKGAEVIRMLHQLVGVVGFRAATDLYFQRFDGQAVTTEDFVQCIEQANDLDLAQFRYWYTQAGTPELNVQQTYDTGEGRLTLEIAQSCSATPGQTKKQPFQIPITVALIDPEGKEILERTIVLTETRQSFDFEGLVKRPVVSFLRNFSAPVKVQFDQSDAELAHLVQFDNNGFSRWEAVQKLALNVLRLAIENEHGDLNAERYETLRAAMNTLTDQRPEDPAMLAEMLMLPDLSYVAEQCQPIDPQRVVNVYGNLQKNLAKDLQTNLHAQYLAHSDSENEFSLASTAMARRALRNIALKILVQGDDARFYELAEQHYQHANNMTDRLAAFSALLHSDYNKKQEIIASFYEDWHHDALVMDKWLAMQAMMPNKNTLATVHELSSHTTFSNTNPNKVRALIGAFTSNMHAFHRLDGAGYEFVASQIIELNELNPQIAARLVGTFNNWRNYAEPYANNMCVQLKRIADTPQLSKDISEIVGKALA